MAPAINQALGQNARNLAIIVAHGSPSDAASVDAAIKNLAERVGQEIGGYEVLGATLAFEGSLDAALERCSGDRQVTIYPFFMSDGWFVAEELPRRVGLLYDGPVKFLTPFGCEPELADLCTAQAEEAAAASGGNVDETTLVLAAHGSGRSRKPAEATNRIRHEIAARGRFREVRVGFIEQAPHLVDIARVDAPALCLPLFATIAGHVLIDVPRALGQAGFAGPCLPPIGTAPCTPHLIARSLTA